MITISKEANAFISKVLEDNKRDAVRLDIDYAGCTGYKYEFMAITNAEIQLADKVVDVDNIRVVLSEQAVEMVSGSEIILQKNGLNSELEVVNPNETARCGCGKSFAV